MHMCLLGGTVKFPSAMTLHFRAVVEVQKTKSFCICHQQDDLPTQIPATEALS